MRREKGGLDIVDLEVWLKDYMDKFSHCHRDIAEDVSQISRQSIAVRRLEGVERNEEFLLRVDEMVDKYMSTTFEENVMTPNVMAAQLDLCQNLPCCCCFRAKADMSMLFCSELSAEVYKSTGLISSKSPVRWSPRCGTPLGG